MSGNAAKYVLWIITVLMILPVSTAYDNYPWINTAMINLDNQWTQDDIAFAADHYDYVFGSPASMQEGLSTTNPDIMTFQFTALGYLETYYIQRLEVFLALPNDYTDQEIEGLYIHYKCDVTIGGQTVPGCDLINPVTGLCSKSAAQGCDDSSAQWLSEARVPDTWYFPDMQTDWRTPNYNSQIYRDFGVWRLNDILSQYPEGYPPSGFWWDNVLSNLGNVKDIDKTIEYWGEPLDWEVKHSRDEDYHEYYDYVTQQMTFIGQFEWLGNVNNMYWIRSTGPWITWALDNLEYISTEGWVAPWALNKERGMPFWRAHCEDIKEVWSHTTTRDIKFHVDCYNYDENNENPDMRTRVFSLGKFYLVSNPNLIYGIAEENTWTLDSPLEDVHWNPMVEVNIGYPKVNPPGVVDFDGLENTNKFFDWLNPTSIPQCWQWPDQRVIARHFDNGLVLVRWKSDRWEDEGDPPLDDPRYNSYIDPQNHDLTNPYGTQYYEILYDGTLAPEPVSSIELMTNEAVVLLQVCEFGPVDATCGCQGVVMNPGDNCACENPIYDSNCDGDIDNDEVGEWIMRWFTSDVPMSILIYVIKLWKII
ncbi:MAG: hypothetical protein KKG59_02590 [Nanoarchaeota archaeon]|nr:hypothetical protein [Nanoarchaeota archaeon]